MVKRKWITWGLFYLQTLVLAVEECLKASAHQSFNGLLGLDPNSALRVLDFTEIFVVLWVIGQSLMMFAVLNWLEKHVLAPRLGYGPTGIFDLFRPTDMKL